MTQPFQKVSNGIIIPFAFARLPSPHPIVLFVMLLPRSALPVTSSSYRRIEGAATSNGEADAGLQGGSRRLEERRRAGRGRRDGRR